MTEDKFRTGKVDKESVDMINNPQHYRSHPSGIECIQITEHMNFNCGNAMKYMFRCGHKHCDPIGDLEKAKWYIQREIERLKKIDEFNRPTFEFSGQIFDITGVNDTGWDIIK